MEGRWKGGAGEEEEDCQAGLGIVREVPQGRRPLLYPAQVQAKLPARAPRTGAKAGPIIILKLDGGKEGGNEVSVYSLLLRRRRMAVVTPGAALLSCEVCSHVASQGPVRDAICASQKHHLHPKSPIPAASPLTSQIDLWPGTSTTIYSPVIPALIILAARLEGFARGVQAEA